MHALLVRGDDGDLGLLVERGDVVHAVLGRAVAAHVVDDATGGHHEPVAALLHALHVPERGVVGQGKQSVASARAGQPVGAEPVRLRGQRLSSLPERPE